MVNISDVFIGTQQSRWAGFAIFSTIIAICLFILFTSTDVSIGQRFSIVLFIILVSLPSILMTLFELTCIVTGGNKKQFWWCHYFAWIVAFIVIIYSIIIIISVIISLFTYNKAMDRVVATESAKKVTKDEANNYAKIMLKNDDKDKFTNENQTQQPSSNSMPSSASSNGGMPSSASSNGGMPSSASSNGGMPSSASSDWISSSSGWLPSSSSQPSSSSSQPSSSSSQPSSWMPSSSSSQPSSWMPSSSFGGNSVKPPTKTDQPHKTPDQQSPSPYSDDNYSAF